MSNRNLRDVELFLLPHTVLQETEQDLRSYGQQQLEARTLWAGTYKDERTFKITRSILPEQACGPVDTIVDHDELLRISQDLYNRGETLAAQVHTHPGAAYHSAIDNAEPITRELGSLSIVVPNYCADPLPNLDHCAVFRLTDLGWCGPYPPTSLHQLIELTEDPS